MPTDFSDGSKDALPCAIGAAPDMGAELTVVHVVNPPARRISNEPRKGNNAMMPRYKIEFTAASSHPQPIIHHYETDDPVTCEQYVADLLELKCKLRGIKHDGVELSRKEFDRIVKNALGMLAARHVCGALGIDTDEAHVRFGTPA